MPRARAAINSSGLVPGVFSKRVVKEYGVLLSTPLADETTPLPSFSPPFHIALALRCIFFSSIDEVVCLLIVDVAEGGRQFPAHYTWHSALSI